MGNVILVRKVVCNRLLVIIVERWEEQAEAIAVQSSSLVEVEVEVKFEFGIEVGVEVEEKVEAQNYFFRVGGWVVRWVGGWLEKWRIKQSSNLKL